jgi:putative DNA primase/helicase
MLISLAKAVAIESELARRGITLKRIGQELVGACPKCGCGVDRFAVNVRKQLWHCRVCNAGGDIVDLVQHLDGVTFVEAVKTLTGEQLQPTPTRTRPAPKGNSDGDKYEKGRRAYARYLWSQRQPIAGSIAETYLRKARGYTGVLPPTLAFLPARKPAHHPAMIAAFAYPNDADPGVLGEPVNVDAVHLTALAPDGTKATNTETPKLMVASPAGRPITVAAMNDGMWGLAITEGIEDALSVHQATGLGAWAAGSAPHMAKLASAIVCAKPESVSIFADGDDAGRRHARELASELSTLVAKLELDIEIRLEEAS